MTHLRMASGSRRDYSPPDPRALGFDWPELQTRLDAVDHLLKELRVTQARLRALTADRLAAVEADRKRLAKAIKEGGKDPGTAATEKVDAEIAGCRRRIEALRDVVADADADLVEAVQAERGELQEEVKARRVDDAMAVLGCLDSLRAALAQASESRGLAIWLRDFPDRPSFHAPPVRLGGVPRAREPIMLEPILEALRVQVAAEAGPEVADGGLGIADSAA